LFGLIGGVCFAARFDLRERRKIAAKNCKN
jgi:hypothetical protein